MTPFEQAHQIAARLGMDFDQMIRDHLRDGYVYSSPDCFICAMDTARDFGDYAEPGIFVTLAVGNLEHFIDIDPLKGKRKWLAFCRQEGGDVHWIPWGRLTKRLATSQK